MQNIRRHFILKFLIQSILVAIMGGGISVVICILAGWRTPQNFADGLFIAGLIVMIVGGGSLLGGQGFSADPMTIYLRLRADNRQGKIMEQNVIMMKELLYNATFMVMMFAAGLLLILSCVIVSKLYGG